jgi:hypothetical protein
MIQIESNNTITKLGCYVLIGMSVLLCCIILSSIEPGKPAGEAWQGVLLVIFIGIVPIKWYLTTLKTRRVTITEQDFTLEQLPDKVLTCQPMNTLVRWWIAQHPKRSSAGRYLHLDFKYGSRVVLLGIEYTDFDKVLDYLTVQYKAKQFVGD